MKDIELHEINTILSDTLRKVMDKEMSLRQANMIAKLASTLSKNIANTELNDRVAFLEEVLKTKR